MIQHICDNCGKVLEENYNDFREVRVSCSNAQNYDCSITLDLCRSCANKVLGKVRNFIFDWQKKKYEDD